MSKKAFNLLDWFNEKLNQEKGTMNFLSGKLKELTNEITDQLKDLTNDSHYLVPILNGLHGDSMDEKGHPALVKMSFRINSRDISIEQIKDYFDLNQNDGRLIIMVHGLMNDESIWHSSPIDLVQRIGSYLESQKMANILYVRYNTGRHISQNGKDLSTLIQHLKDQYGNNNHELILIGHSMGGLVIRSAGYYASKLNHNWLLLLKKVFLIGVPNEGSYVARIAYNTQYFLRKIDLTKNYSFAKFFEIRSNGIKDLSFGYLIDEDWQNPNYENEKNMKATKVFPIQNIEYYLIAGTVSDKEDKSKIFTFFGDGLVEKESALSSLFKEKEIQSEQVSFKLFTEENHLSLLESQNVQKYILECLGWTKV
jgi:pimeloyl-ACP methyl ester carboxylesterase